MRTVKPKKAADRDEGAVLIMVALMMTMLLGIGALVIDLGALYVEKRELQNGADAAALAIAQGCAGGNCGAPNAIAKQYVDLNARDGASGVAEVCGSPAPLAACSTAAPAGAAGATGWVKVADVTQTSGGGNQVQFVLAPIMNSLTGATMRASAVAAWGPLGSGTVTPLIFSVCEYLEMGGTVSPPSFPAGQRNYIYFHGIGGSGEPGVGSCTGSPSGQDLPGGFGYLANTNCLATISAGGWVGVETGNSLPRSCNPAAWLNNEILIAIYDQERGSGSNGEYHVAGFVGLRVLGYKLGNDRSPGFGRCPEGNGNSSDCIYGEFTRFTTDGGGFGGSNFGSVAVKMVG